MYTIQGAFIFFSFFVCVLLCGGGGWESDNTVWGFKKMCTNSSVFTLGEGGQVVGDFVLGFLSLKFSPSCIRGKKKFQYSLSSLKS